MTRLQLDLINDDDDRESDLVAEFNIRKLLRQNQVNTHEKQGSNIESKQKGDAINNQGQSTSRLGNDGSLLMSVVASLEYRYGQQDYVDSEEEDAFERRDNIEDEDEENDECKDSIHKSFKLSQDDIDDMGSTSEGNITLAPRRVSGKSVPKKVRKATKEERRWFDDGKGFLAEDLMDAKAELNDHMLQVMNSELQFDGFYVHRGPLLSKERIAHFQKLCDTDESALKKTKKKRKLSHNAETDISKGNTNFVLSSLDTNADISRENKNVETEVVQLVTRLVKRLHTALEDQEKEADNVEKTKVENQKDGVLQSFNKRIDQGLLQLAPLLINRKEDSAEPKRLQKKANLLYSLQNIQALFPRLSLSDLEKHVMRVQAAQVVRTARKHHMTKVSALRKYITERRSECKISLQLKPVDWVSALRDTEFESIAQLTELLHRLYFSQSCPVKPNDEFVSSSWDIAIEELEKVWTSVSSKQKGKLARDHKMKYALCIGFMKRRMDETSCFLWDLSGISILQSVGKSFKKLYLAALEAWRLEVELMKRRKTLCRNRRQEMESLATSVWASKDENSSAEMSAFELLAITMESNIEAVNLLGRDVKDKKKVTGDKKAIANAAVSSLKKNTTGKTKEKKAMVDKSKPLDEDSIKSAMSVESKSKSEPKAPNKPVTRITLPLRGEVFDDVVWSVADFKFSKKSVE